MPIRILYFPSVVKSKVVKIFTNYFLIRGRFYPAPSVSVKYRRTRQRRKETDCRGARQPVIYTNFVYRDSKAGFSRDTMRKAFQKKLEIWKRPQAVCLGGLYNGVDSSAGVGPHGGIGKQPVLPSNCEGAHRAFRPVVRQFQASVQKSASFSAQRRKLAPRQNMPFGTGFLSYSSFAQANNFSASGLDRSQRAWYRS